MVADGNRLDTVSEVIDSIFPFYNEVEEKKWRSLAGALGELVQALLGQRLGEASGTRERSVANRLAAILEIRRPHLSRRVAKWRLARLGIAAILADSDPSISKDAVRVLRPCLLLVFSLAELRLRKE
jgi:hypothetical protein